MPSAKCLVVLLVVLEAAGCTTDTQERIKMCGRDLIRLAVSSCGNSRLRRSVPDVKEGRHQETSREASWTTRPTPVPADDGEGFSLVPRWHPVSPRFRRTAGEISDICCEKGCSMKELIQFC
ncbi:insulin-like 3 (Leydig cell) [Takifugu flavidus]|nr:insulin-like 3 (Leydig cell) [Takifugu flavidus]